MAFFALVMVMSLSTYLSMNFSQSASSEMRLMVEDQTRRALLAQRAAKRLQFATIQLLTLLQTPDREDRVPLYRTMDQALLGADAAARTLSKELNTSEIQRFLELRERYGETFQATVEEIEFNGLEAAQAHFVNNTQPVLNDLLAEAEAVSVSQQDAMILSESKYQQQVKQLSSTVLAIEVVVIFLGLLFSVLFARSLAALLNDPIQVADRIASGDYTTSIPSAKVPELQRLLRALEHMRSGILGREQHIKRLAFEDRLTQLGSRLLFLQKLEEAVQRVDSTLVLLDINRFTQINKALGHAFGDEVLTKVARRLERFSDASFNLSRLESNRFGMIIPAELAHEAAATVRGVLAAFEQPIEISDQRIHVDMRAAIVRVDRATLSPEALQRSAEAALDRAKHRQTNCIELSEIEPPADGKSLTLLSDLKRALSEEQFHLVFQPKWCSSKERITGVEALIRWTHPERGMIPPDGFIPFCEQTGFIRQITPWVITEAAAAASRWRQQGLDLVVAVNLSTLDLDNPALEEHLKRTLREYQLPPEKLCLEVTESALMSDPEAGKECLERLRELGLKLAIDDYGTGQASLAYVRDLPVQELKIDRSFVTEVHNNPRTAAIVRSTLTLCQELGISQVAEGVENREELLWLMQNNCSLIQGYFISKPLPERELVELVSKTEERQDSPT